MNNNILVILALMQIVSPFVQGDAVPCMERRLSTGTVCVCNSTYCDTVAPNPHLPHGQYSVYTTTQAGHRLHRSQHYFTQQQKGSMVLTVERDTVYQKIIGFGGAFTDAAGINIDSLKPATADKLLQSYYSPHGIEYTLGRVPMASCDFSAHIYSYDDSMNDYSLANFSLTQEDYKYKMPYMHAAVKMSERDIKFYGSPWSSPAWMKTSGKMEGPGTLQGSAGDNYHKTWAMYFIRFLEAYSKNNLTMWGITAQNEPMTGFMPNYPFQTMGFTAETQRDFIKHDLGPALRKHGFGDVKLMIVDDQRSSLPQWPKTVMSDIDAAQYVSGVAVHWYEDFIFPAFPLTMTHQAVPELFILYTEACEGYKTWAHDVPVILGSWHRLQTYTKNIMDDLENWVSGWTDWNLALDMEGGPNWVKNFVDSPIIVNKDKDEFYKQPMFYALGHFSKFLPPDSIRIGLKIENKPKDSDLQMLAFSSPDGSTIVIVSNQGSSDVDYNIVDGTRTIASTSPAKSILTYIWW